MGFFSYLFGIKEHAKKDRIQRKISRDELEKVIRLRKYKSISSKEKHLIIDRIIKGAGRDGKISLVHINTVLFELLKEKKISTFDKKSVNDAVKKMFESKYGGESDIINPKEDESDEYIKQLYE